MARAAQAVIDELEELVDLIGREQGRPAVEAEVLEVLPAVETLQWLAEEGPGILAGERIRFSRTQHPVKRGRWSYEPLGVVAVLGGPGEPFASPLGDVAVALMAGNGVVFKPSPHVALCGERIARVFARAGLPERLLRVVHGHTDTGAALVDAAVAQVRFTGSVRAGRAVGAACAHAFKRSVISVGGGDAALVLADASLPRVVRGLAWAAFANAGQSGGSVARVVCVPEVHDRVLEGLVARARTLHVGDPADAGTEVGPVVTRERRDHVLELVQDAVEAGATLHCGGPHGDTHLAPMVLSGVTPAMRLHREEVPGPLVCVERAASETDGIARMNAGGRSLGASVWTADRFKGARIAGELRVGMVWMNDHLVTRSAPQVPWGGVRGSGLGRARGAIALRTCAEPKVVTWDPPASRPAWWFGYDERLAHAAAAVVRLRSRRDADRERALKDLPALLGVTGRWVRGLRRG
jgi:acyl-CoA reductase-like NAD-dependent aldehyde dehydrogenase